MSRPVDCATSESSPRRKFSDRRFLSRRSRVQRPSSLPRAKWARGEHAALRPTRLHFRPADGHARASVLRIRSRDIVIQEWQPPNPLVVSAFASARYPTQRAGRMVRGEGRGQLAYVSSLVGPCGPLALQDAIPFSAAALDEYSSLVPMTSPLTAFRRKYGLSFWEVLRS